MIWVKCRILTIPSKKMNTLATKNEIIFVYANVDTDIIERRFFNIRRSVHQNLREFLRKSLEFQYNDEKFY